MSMGVVRALIDKARALLAPVIEHSEDHCSRNVARWADDQLALAVIEFDTTTESVLKDMEQVKKLIELNKLQRERDDAAKVAIRRELTHLTDLAGDATNQWIAGQIRKHVQAISGYLS